MARSWQYPRWRRVVAQAVLWAVFAATVGMAGLVVRQRRLAGSVELTNPYQVDLPAGVRVTARLPKGWLVTHDESLHQSRRDGRHDPGQAEPPARGPGADADPVELFHAQEPAGGVGTPDPDAEAGAVDRQVSIRCQTLAGPPPLAAAYLDASGLLADTVSLAGNPRGRAGPASGVAPVAGVDGCWVAVERRVPSAPGLSGPNYDPAYVAVGVVPLGPGASMAVSVVLLCPSAGPDPAGDQDLLRRVAAAVTVDPDRRSPEADNRRRP